MEISHGEVTRLLIAAQAGDTESYNKIYALLYEELKLEAQKVLRRESRNHTLIPEALIHELYIKLLKQEKVGGSDRSTFRAICAVAMRQILIDRIRKKNAIRRGKNYKQETLTSLNGYFEPLKEDRLIALEEAMERLALVDKDLETIVTLRFFSGFTTKEIASQMSLTYEQVRAKWNFAKHWLNKELAH